MGGRAGRYGSGEREGGWWGMVVMIEGVDGGTMVGECCHFSVRICNDNKWKQWMMTMVVVYRPSIWKYLKGSGVVEELED